jgi:hypothetical protein
MKGGLHFTSIYMGFRHILDLGFTGMSSDHI